MCLCGRAAPRMGSTILKAAYLRREVGRCTAVVLRAHKVLPAYMIRATPDLLPSRLSRGCGAGMPAEAAHPLVAHHATHSGAAAAAAVTPASSAAIVTAAKTPVVFSAGAAAGAAAPAGAAVKAAAGAVAPAATAIAGAAPAAVTDVAAAPAADTVGAAAPAADTVAAAAATADPAAAIDVAGLANAARAAAAAAAIAIDGRRCKRQAQPTGSLRRFRRRQLCTRQSCRQPLRRYGNPAQPRPRCSGSWGARHPEVGRRQCCHRLRQSSLAYRLLRRQARHHTCPNLAS